MKKSILFLLRTYNDIDHIAPVIWKAVTSDWPSYVLFVDRDYSTDYRIRFVVKCGAIPLHCRAIEWYHDKIRRFLVPRIFRRSCDRLIAYSFGLYFLKRHNFQVVVNEWSGPFGRERAEYFLRPANFLDISIYSLPHGYFLWKNPLFNQELADYYEENGRFPDFSNRNEFTRYVVQSPEHKAANIEYGMAREKLVILGSARFCEEWSEINHSLMVSRPGKSIPSNGVAILFFLPHWNYNVYRIKCVSLILEIAKLPGVSLTVKAHTRGSGTMSAAEQVQLSENYPVVFADDTTHSASLVYEADIVINFGSSIGFEALRQGKPVINPTYLHNNQTFFDNSGAVYDVHNQESTLNQIKYCLSHSELEINRQAIDKFLLERVDGMASDLDVLQSYLNVLSDSYQQESC